MLVSVSVAFEVMSDYFQEVFKKSYFALPSTVYDTSALCYTLTTMKQQWNIIIVAEVTKILQKAIMENESPDKQVIELL